jgi:hypothetical protein
LRHDLLDAPILLVHKAILLLVVVLVVVLVLVDVVVLVRVVVLLTLGEIGDEVGGITAPEAALCVSGVSSPLLSKLVHCLKFPCNQGNLVVGNALILLTGSYSKRRQNKLQRR